MKRLASIIALFCLLMMQAANTAHAGCVEGADCFTEQAVQISNHTDDSGDQQQAACDCCACAHHHHSHAVFLSIKATDHLPYTEAYSAREGNSYLSLKHYPPAKPPKA